MASARPNAAQIRDFVLQSNLLNLDVPLRDVIEQATALGVDPEVAPVHFLALTSYVLVTDVVPVPVETEN